MHTYEAMLLVEPTIAAREWPRVIEEIDRLAKKNGATVLQVAKWGERKLAFPVRKCARGTYVLAYFGAPEKAVTKLRADIGLSEVILRSLVLAHEGEMRKEVSRDFEIAGPVPPKRELGGGFAPPREASLMGGPPPRR
jgi:small subunit ribosomal protein S6